MDPETIREFCLGFPSATENLQWGDDLCFKINGKIFVTLGLDNPRLCFKCSAESFSELVEREDIRPAPYVGRYKWVMLDRLDALQWDELKPLIQQSYEMVAAKSGGPRGKGFNNGKRSAKKSGKTKTPVTRKARKQPRRKTKSR